MIRRSSRRMRFVGSEISFSIRKKIGFVNQCTFAEQEKRKNFQMFAFLLYKTPEKEYDIFCSP